MKLINKRVEQAEAKVRYITKDNRVIIVWDTDPEFFEYEGKKYKTDKHLADNLKADYPEARIVIVAWE